MVLKRSTPQNIVIGGAAGALPPMIGWAAASGSLSAGPDRALPVHLPVDAAAFLGAGALPRGDYERVGVPMMPNVVGPVKTCRQIVAYSLLLVASSFGPLLIPGVGLRSMRRSRRSAARSSCCAPSRSIACARRRKGARRKAAMALFRFSILYMFLLFAAFWLSTLVNRW